jgi:hypothetical protein
MIKISGGTESAAVVGQLRRSGRMATAAGVPS